MQRALFPMQYLRITQDENSTYSHAGSLAMDFGGQSGATDDKVYAPCDMKIVRVRTDSSHETYAESIEKVLWADGTEDYMNFTFMHDNYINSNVKAGAVIKQGTYFYDEGGFGGGKVDKFARHLHLEVGRGKSPAMQQKNSKGTYITPGQVNIYKALFVGADCTILNGGGHTWVKTTDKLLDTSGNQNNTPEDNMTYLLELKNTRNNQIFKTPDPNGTVIAEKDKVKPGLYPVIEPVVSGVAVSDTKWCQIMFGTEVGYAVYGGALENAGARILEPSQIAREYGSPLTIGGGVPQDTYDAVVKENSTLKQKNETLAATNTQLEKTAATYKTERDTLQKKFDGAKTYKVIEG